MESHQGYWLPASCLARAFGSVAFRVSGWHHILSSVPNWLAQTWHVLLGVSGIQTSRSNPLELRYILQVFLLVSYGTFDWHADALAAMATTIAMRIMYLPQIRQKNCTDEQYYQWQLLVTADNYGKLIWPDT